MVWAALSVAAVPGTVLTFVVGGLLLAFVPELVFGIDGGGYAADGLSFVPGAATLMLLGLPSLRSRGLLLTVSTLSFAVVVPTWLIVSPAHSFRKSWCRHSAGRPLAMGASWPK